MKPILTIIKRLLASNIISFIITTVVVLLATTSSTATIAISKGNYTWLLAILTPFFFVFYDYPKLVHLGASKKDYFQGILISYGILAVVISFINSGFYLLIDPLNQQQTVINMITVCGWNNNGIIIALIQQSIFLFLVMIFLHTLLSIQDNWKGWLCDGILIGILCIFIPVASLRVLLVRFFNLIMFNSNGVIHILSCLIISLVIIIIELKVIKQKTT